VGRSNSAVYLGGKRESWYGMLPGVLILRSWCLINRESRFLVIST
jgi:hypothetical protein